MKPDTARSPQSNQCGQILETLKGNTAKLCKLQILNLRKRRKAVRCGALGSVRGEPMAFRGCLRGGPRDVSRQRDGGGETNVRSRLSFAVDAQKPGFLNVIQYFSENRFPKHEARSHVSPERREWSRSFMSLRKTIAMPYVNPPSNKRPDQLSNLDFILQALAAAGRLPCERPESGLPQHFTVENMQDLHIERHGGGWVANLQFRNVPAGQPDCVGTPDAFPFDEEEDALWAGMALVCRIATSSPELPFVRIGEDLVVPTYRAQSHSLSWKSEWT
ncbi:hypothetical protein ACFORG_03995 [Lutimaribacter marinistellae]|uniref:Uncharacterized protein n=1 Tax=Lutimaribacter marinistellae TaxID=1820329 RepID=A0ABV7TBL8_9RHOB